MERIIHFILLLISFTLWNSVLIEGKPPKGWTPTPNGLLPSHCVKEVPSGSVIGKEENHLRITHPSGKEELFPLCDFKRNNTGVVNGWIAWTEMGGSNFNSFSGTWDVPADVVGKDDEIDYFFTGLVAGGYIIQPVLQWGVSEAGGGYEWALASWYVSDSSAVYSSLVVVNAGDTVIGTMTMPSQGNWEITASVSGGTPTTLYPTGLPYQTAAYVTLEAYTIYNCTDLPPDKLITFSNLQLQEYGRPINPAWDTDVTNNACNERVDVINSAEITIAY